MLAEVEPRRVRIIALSEDMKHEEDFNYMENNYVRLTDDANSYINQIINHAQDRVGTLTAGIEARESRAVVFLMAMGVASALISVFFGICITRGIGKPVRELETVAQSMAHGI